MLMIPNTSEEKRWSLVDVRELIFRYSRSQPKSASPTRLILPFYALDLDSPFSSWLGQGLCTTLKEKIEGLEISLETTIASSAEGFHYLDSSVSGAALIITINVIKL